MISEQLEVRTKADRTRLFALSSLVHQLLYLDLGTSEKSHSRTLLSKRIGKHLGVPIASHL